MNHYVGRIVRDLHGDATRRLYYVDREQDREIELPSRHARSYEFGWGAESPSNDIGETAWAIAHHYCEMMRMSIGGVRGRFMPVCENEEENLQMRLSEVILPYLPGNEAFRLAESRIELIRALEPAISMVGSEEHEETPEMTVDAVNAVIGQSPYLSENQCARITETLTECITETLSRQQNQGSITP